MKLIQHSTNEREDGVDINLYLTYKGLYLIIFFLVAYALFTALLVKLFI